ncbi:hypothetical protein ACFL6X_09810, partial [Candidatus Latescibacterota bacterium]
QMWDRSKPGTRELVNEIVHGTFCKEGTAVAMFTGFPGAAAPIRADESYITAMDATPTGAVYGGTSGHAAHLFVAMVHGMTGIVFDMGTVGGCDSTAAMCCTGDAFVAGVNGASGGRIVTRHLQPLPFDLIQEWGFHRQPYTDLGLVQQPEPIVHAVATADRKRVVGATTQSLFTVDPEAKEMAVVGRVPGSGRLAVDAAGRVLGMDGDAALWAYDPKSNKLERQAIDLPKKGSWKWADLRWARDPRDGSQIVADGEGRLFAWDGKTWSPPLAKVQPAPINCMAITFDGRLFGHCGDGIGRLFSYDPEAGKMTDIGVAASVFNRRRYGYAFGDAVVGRDGEVVFGENDALGHLWLYFPKVKGA